MRFRALGVRILGRRAQTPTTSFQLSFQGYSSGPGDANLEAGK
jgi:hypothetical protein